MAKGLHNATEETMLDIFFRGASAPGTDEFTLRLANSLLLRVTGTSASNWSIGETVEGSTSSDTGTLEGTQDNGDGSVTLKLSGIGEAEVFSIGETITGQYSAASGTLDNASMTLSNVSNSYFQENEQIVDGSTSATADIKAVYGNVVELNNLVGSFGVGNTITGQESGATATIDKHYAGIPGLFDSDTVSDIIDEATNYSAITLSSNDTDWPTLTTDLAGNAYVESREVTFEASGGQLGPINLGILTVNIDSGGEEIVSTAPIKGTPPSDVIDSGGTILTKFTQKLA